MKKKLRTLLITAVLSTTVSMSTFAAPINGSSLNNTIKTNSISNIGVSYSSHVQNVGWQSPASDGSESGTHGQSLRLEALKINLTGDLPAGAGITYRTQVQNVGWQSWSKNGEEAGTDGKGLREEAIEISLNGLPGYSVQYRVHVQNIGWQAWVSDGALAGTVGKSLRLEALEIRIVKNSYGIGETATINDEYSGKYELTINKVELTDQRNEFSNTNPAEVYKITYTYKLLAKGSETNMGLFIYGFDTVTDNKGLAGDPLYPDSVNKNPQELKNVGDSCVAESFVAVNNVTNSLNLTENYYNDTDGDGYPERTYAQFVIPTK